MRIRTLKPEFWVNEEMACLHDKARLLAIGLLNYADDEGFFSANPKLIRSVVFPFDADCKSAEKGLDSLESIGYIKRFQGKDEKVIGWVVKFTTHQVINRPTPSKLKPLIDPHAIHDCLTLTESSLNRQGALTLGREGKGTDTAQARPPPEPFPNENRTSFRQMSESRFKNEVESFSEFSEYHAEFVDYWTEKNPSGKMKFQLQETWDTLRRLATWRRNSEQRKPWKTHHNKPANVSAKGGNDIELV